jgi:nicotinate-nucleotide adenylyltransferase
MSEAGATPPRRIGVRRIGVLGGTFDPPHRAHLALASAAREALDLDVVIVVPAGDPWRKADRGVSPAEVRLALTRIAFEDLAWVTVSPIEVRRAGPSYTADTLEQLRAREEYAGAEWWFILGQDALVDLQHWHEPERILAQARLAVATRGGLDGGEIEATEAVPALRGRIDEVPFEPLDVSATAIRAQIAAGDDSPDLPARVRAVIDELKLYR